jgi:hypothetical protein
MSFDIFLQRNDANRIIPFKRSILAEILGPYALVDKDRGIYGALFPNGERPEIYGAEKEDISFLSLNRFGSMSLQVMWEVADRTHSYIFWPEGDPNKPHLVVTSAESLAELDPGIVDAIGPAVIAKNGEELEQLIYA